MRATDDKCQLFITRHISIHEIKCVKYLCTIVNKKNHTKFAFKLSYLNFNFALTLGYFNRALNNPALVFLK